MTGALAAGPLPLDPSRSTSTWRTDQASTSRQHGTVRQAVAEAAAIRSARVEYSPPVPSPALELLQTSPPSTPVSSTAKVPSARPFVPAPAPPHPHFLFQAPMNPPVRRPKTADSRASAQTSKGSFKRALASVFSSGSSSVKQESRSSPASFQQVSSPTAAVVQPMDQATRRLRAMQIARETGRKAVAYVRRKLNSKTPEDQLPKTWKEFEVLYANGDVDVSDPPLPPQRVAPEGSEPTPFEQKVWAAPMGPDEPIRQDVVDRLDLFGLRSAASQATLEITTGPRSAAMTPSDSQASTSSYLTSPSYASSSRRGSLSAQSTVSTTTTATTANPAAPEQDAVQSLENSPVFRSIISKAREVFDVPIAVVTVLDGDKQLFLASGGLPEGVGNVMPRTSSFCQHTILGGGMVVLNATEDWRFANNILTTNLGGRFYAGTPVNCHAPGDTESAAMPIGSLCVLDTKAREDFSDAHRRVLRDLGQQCANAIEAWSSERRAHKVSRVRGSLPTESAPQLPTGTLGATSAAPEPAARSTTDLARPLLKASRGPSIDATPSSVVYPRRRGSAANPPTSALPATPPASIRHGGLRESAHTRTNSDAESVRTTASSVPASDVIAPRRPSALSLGITTEDPISTLPRDVQKMFDAAVRMLARSLELELVYLAALDLAAVVGGAGESDAASVSSMSGSALAPGTSHSVSGKLRVLASHGLPSPAPSFDPLLHVKALRAPEGGLIYKNPRFSPAAGASFASGNLIPVLEVRRTGFILCSYSRDPARQFAQRDLALLVKMAEGLETHCIRAAKSLATAAFA